MTQLDLDALENSIGSLGLLDLEPQCIALIRELRAARQVVEAARRTESAFRESFTRSGLDHIDARQLRNAIAAYDAAVKGPE